MFADADGATRLKEVEKLEELRQATGLDGLTCGSRCFQDARCTVEVCICFQKHYSYTSYLETPAKKVFDDGL